MSLAAVCFYLPDVYLAVGIDTLIMPESSSLSHVSKWKTNQAPLVSKRCLYLREEWFWRCHFKKNDLKEKADYEHFVNVIQSCTKIANLPTVWQALHIISNIYNSPKKQVWVVAAERVESEAEWRVRSLPQIAQAVHECARICKPGDCLQSTLTSHCAMLPLKMWPLWSQGCRFAQELQTWVIQKWRCWEPLSYRSKWEDHTAPCVLHFFINWKLIYREWLSSCCCFHQ